MLTVNVQPYGVEFGGSFCLAFHRTLRIPDDGRRYPLPPGLGAFPLLKDERFNGIESISPEVQTGVLLPMYQREALWLGFVAKIGTHYAIKVGAGMINAVTGAPFDLQLRGNPQDYLVCPGQLWLDGFKTDADIIRQFVAMPLGSGHTIEGALSGNERIGGIQIAVFAGRPGAFPKQEERGQPGGPTRFASPQSGMGLGAGGQMRQKIYPDPYGLDAWDQEQFGFLHVSILNSVQYEEMTGKEPPPTPIDARTYTEHGLPWFDLYDENAPDLTATVLLREAATIADRDRELKLTDLNNTPVEVETEQIKILRPPPH